jgi:NitT/TauT family transport system ATP-binding protein
LLRLRQVEKVFGNGSDAYTALAGIDLDIRDGEFLCLLGPSGCGKSTLLNILAGFEPVSGGSVEHDGAAITGAGQDRMMFFQDAGSALLPWLSVAENLRFALRVRKVPKAQWEEIVDKYLSMVDLQKHRDKFPAQLSGGMRQRLQIARGLAIEPRVLLMDEPFAALDAMIRRRMHAFLIDIWRRTGQTIVFVTHDIAEALVLADRIAVMSVGPRSRIMETIAMPSARPRDLTVPEVAQHFKTIETLLSSEIERSEVFAT